MPRFIRLDRIKKAIYSLSNWRDETQSQASAHLFPFLALLEEGVNAEDFTDYEEQDDFDFFNAYFNVPGDESSPYFDPLTRTRRIQSHPHSNVATARKNTFQNRWHAGESRVTSEKKTQWKLARDCAEILRQRVMTKSGEVTRPNCVDVAVWLFRDKEFGDSFTTTDLRNSFQQQFRIPADYFSQLFAFRDENPETVFSDTKVTQDELQSLIDSICLKTTHEVAIVPAQQSPQTQSSLEEDDPILQEVKKVLAIDTSGIIFRGCPGTGKSWYAWNIALALTNNDPNRIKRVQFHPSYGYEDFVEGYRPSTSNNAGFEVVAQVFLKAAEQASSTQESIVFIIDEINRGDCSRVFGEVLTYIEHGWRDVPFVSPYRGVEIRIPRNLIVLATMNPHDRSITQLDMALLRRFDHIDIAPSSQAVDQFLQVAGMPADQSSIVVGWFNTLQKILPYGIGHTYFRNVGDIGRLLSVWKYRILPFCENVLEFEPEQLKHVKDSFESARSKLFGDSGTSPE